MSDKKDLSSEAKWLILKFIGIFIAGAWAILFALSYHFYNTLNDAATAKVTIDVKDAVANELSKFESLREKIESASERALEAQLRAELSAKYSREIQENVETVKTNIPEMENTVKLLNKLTKARQEIVDQIVRDERFRVDVSRKLLQLPIGTIIPSMLKPDIFLKKWGEEGKKKIWVLADGNEIPIESSYCNLTKKVKVPDLRGMFLRGVNEGRSDKYRDPETNREPFSYQEDELEKHNHKLQKTVFKHHRSFKGENDSDHALKHQKGEKGDVWIDGTIPFGEEETRPKNFSVYWYIKIN